MNEATNQLRKFRKTVGRNIHDLRVEKKIPLARLVQMLNVRPQTIDRYEMGNRKISIEFISIIAAAFNVSIFRLTGEGSKE